MPVKKSAASRTPKTKSKRLSDTDRSFAPAKPYDFEEAIEHLKKRDPLLKKLIEKVEPFNLVLDLELSSFDHLFKAIVYQQLTGKAASTIHARTKALLDPKGSVPHQLAELSIENLRTAGLSRAKAAYLKDLAEKEVAGHLPSNSEMAKMTDEEIIERLTVIKGIGRWSVEMLLIFHLGRPDVLPVGDYGVRKGFSYLYGNDQLPNAKELTAHAEIWRPYRSIASWYMWRATESIKPKIAIVSGKSKTKAARKPPAKPMLKVRSVKTQKPSASGRSKKK